MRCVLLLTAVGCHDYGLVSSDPGHPGAGPAWEESGPQPRLAYQPTSESWDLTGGAADLLFFGDTSGSMSQELETLGAEAESIVAALEAYTIDWRLLAVTGPDGCGNNGVLSRDSQDYAALFADGLTRSPGADGVDEWGLYNAREAIRQSEPGLCNDGFLRRGATLQVVFISDEDDNSPGYDDGDPAYWREYTDEILWHYAGDQPVIFSTISGPDPGGCDGAEPGVGYWQAAEEADGARLSICGDWSAELDLLARLSATRRLFALSEEPMPWSITVWVDGEERTTGWRYEPADGWIRFDDDPPVSGQEVVIDYLVLPLDGTPRVLNPTEAQAP